MSSVFNGRLIYLLSNQHEISRLIPSLHNVDFTACDQQVNSLHCARGSQLIRIIVDNRSIFSLSGEFGRYQGFQFFLHILSAVCAGLHMLTLFTINAIPEHRCFIEGVDQLNASAAWNSTEILAAIPEKEPGVLESCVMFVQGTNDTQACTSYVFDDTYYKDTRAIDWGMVCENRYRGAIAQTIYMLGVFTGAVVLGKNLKIQKNYEVSLNNILNHHRKPR